MKKIFVTGTDTNVGKTICSAALVLALNAYYWKPVQTGEPDTEKLSYLTSLTAERILPAQYSLQAALSPDQAAQLENKIIDLANLTLPLVKNHLVVEGAGGILAPLNQEKCMIDLMQQLNLPVVIVSRGILGTINHTLMTIDILRRKGLTILGIIFSGELNPANQLAIEQRGEVRTLLHVPYFPQLTAESLQRWVRTQRESIREVFHVI